MTSYLKTQAFRSDRWLRSVAALACVLCKKEGSTQTAHRNEGKGMATKTDDCWTAALCVDCHRQIDQGKDLSRDERRQQMNNAILRTLLELCRRGDVGVLK